MKKFFAATLALLAIAAGCQKEIEETAVPVQRVPISISPVLDEQETKAIFEDVPGAEQQFIVWEAGDEIDINIKESSAEDAVSVQGWGSSIYKMGDDPSKPAFNGYLYYTQHNPTEVLYAIYPADLSCRWDDNPKSVYVSLPEVQNPSQKGFDGKCDLMVSQAFPLGEELAKTYPLEGGVMYVTNPVSLKLDFAHLFGFGRLAFDCTQHAEEKVQRVEIKAKGICGTFTVDMTAGYNSLKATSTNPGNSDNAMITVSADGSVALKDYVCWFVAAPGNYDEVHVLVYTDKGVLAYDRNTLSIARSRITRKTIHSTTNDDISKRKLLRSYKVRTAANTWSMDTFSLEFDASNRLLAFNRNGYQQWSVSYPSANTIVYDLYGVDYTVTLNGDGQIVSSVRESGDYRTQTSFTYSGSQLVTRTAEEWYNNVKSSSLTTQFSWSGSDLVQIERLSGSSANFRKTITAGTTKDLFNLSSILLTNGFSDIDPLDMLMATTNSFHTQYIPAQVVNNNLELESSSVDKYLVTVDESGLVTTLKYYKNNICRASVTFSYSLEEAPDPDFPDDTTFPGSEKKLPRHLIRKDASGNRDVTDLTYDAAGRLTGISRSGSSGTLTASYTWGETTATLEVDEGGSKSTYTYTLEDGKVVSATGPHTLEKRTSSWGDVEIAYDGTTISRPYNGGFVDSKGGIGMAYVFSECPEYGGASLFPLFQGMEIASLYNNGCVPTYYYKEDGGETQIIRWLLTADADGDLAEILTVKDGKTVASLSISYSDVAPDEPFLLPVSPTVTGKKVRQIEEKSGGGNPELSTIYYNDEEPWIFASGESIEVMITSGTRTTAKDYTMYLNRDSEDRFIVDRDDSGNVIKVISGQNVYQFSYSDGLLTKANNGNETMEYEWTDGNVTRIIMTDSGNTVVYKVKYGSLKDNVGILPNRLFGNGAGWFLPKLCTKNVPVKIEMESDDETITTFEFTYEYETDASGDITRVREHIARGDIKRLQSQKRYFYNYDPIPKDGTTVTGGASGEDYEVKPL